MGNDLDIETAAAAPRATRTISSSSDPKFIGETTELQGNSQFYETITAAPLDPWSKTSVQLYFILLVAALNATASGFDGVSEVPSKRWRWLCFSVLANNNLSVNLQLD